jgi:hypothetical protein
MFAIALNTSENGAHCTYRISVTQHRHAIGTNAKGGLRLVARRLQAEGSIPALPPPQAEVVDNCSFKSAGSRFSKCTADLHGFSQEYEQFIAPPYDGDRLMISTSVFVAHLASMSLLSYKNLRRIETG